MSSNKYNALEHKQVWRCQQLRLLEQQGAGRVPVVLLEWISSRGRSWPRLGRSAEIRLFSRAWFPSAGASNGSFVSGHEFIRAADGSFVSGHEFIRAADGSFVSGHEFIRAADGSFASGHEFIRAADGSFVSGHEFIRAADGSFVSGHEFIRAAPSPKLARALAPVGP